MKTPFILTCACAAALVFPLSSCSTQNSSTAGYDTAEPASGEIPPWIAESSDPAYESGHYSPVQSSSSYAYNPPAKPSVTKNHPRGEHGRQQILPQHGCQKELLP